MDRSERRNNKRQSGKKVPRVPIKTYKWEDVRRARRKGGYPWTYLYKAAFNESIDSKDFRMDGLKKSKTSTTSSASDSLDIKEITEEDVKGLEGIDSSYVVIEGPILLGGQIEEITKDAEGIIESADSSDNISQYLDKDDRGPDQQMESTETLTLPGPSTPEILTAKERSLERAKSEEPKRKRKLSIESNYSRISLSRLGLMKRLRDAKEKIKLPKLGKSPKSEKKIIPATEEVQPEVKKEWIPKPRNNENPVYIHIPLKPPEGITDEFSYLEFEEKRPQAPAPPPPPEVQIEITEDSESEKDKENIPEIPEKNAKRNEASSKGTTLGVGELDSEKDDVSAIIFLEGDEEGDDKEGYDIMVVDIDENSQEMTMSEVTSTKVRRQVLDSIKNVESQTDLTESKQNSGGNLSRTSSKASKISKDSIRKRRAKSADPEKKRRSSIESSYSRKSLSKIGFLKKLKELHLPFRKSQSKKSVTDASSTKKEIVPEPTPAEIPRTERHSKDQKPVYIHIPLKPPAGQTDEFSYLEFETAPPPKPKNEPTETNEAKEEENSPIESPDTSRSPQFIFLTPPSDDEILDKPDIPETPSSETGSLFQFVELKQLAKNAVEQIQGTLDSVDEEVESKGEDTKVATDAIMETLVEEHEKSDNETEENIMIDEEDGLKSTQEAKPALKSNLKAEASPLPKKKVSFKRRKSSQVSKDDGYEEIQSPSDVSQASVSSESTVKTSILDNSQSMSVDEEKSYLDSEKVVKSASLEEDYNKWSKISDHEYEPINPPPDEKLEMAPPKSHVSEVLNPSLSPQRQYSHDDTQLDLSIQDMQSEIENRFFNKDNASTNLTTTKIIEKRSSPARKSPSKRSSRSRSREKEPPKPNKFQTAIKESATKFKTKLQGIKKPNISLPPRPKFQKPNIKKPNINLPKLPNLASTFRRRSKPEENKTVDQAKTTEDAGNEGQGIFDFSTFPRLFKKKKQDFDSLSLKGKTVTHKAEKKDEAVKSHRWGTSSGQADSIRIPLHSEESMDQENGINPQPKKPIEKFVEPEETILETTPPRRYQEDIDADDEDIRQLERQEKHRSALRAASEPDENRWDHGNFYQTQNGTSHRDDDEENLESYEREEHQEIITDLDQTEDQPFVSPRERAKLQQNDSLDTNHSRDAGSSISSLGQHRRGVLEEIDSDQFFLREKGISQDNIDMGRYLSTEIREAFRTPTNALADMRGYNYEEMRASNQSLPETKRKQVKKPKRRKTPHASQERLRYDQESENEDYNFMPPIRPRRRSKRRKRPEPETTVIPYTETISVDPSNKEGDYLAGQEDNFDIHYENNQMEAQEQLHIGVTKPYKDSLQIHDIIQRRASEPVPAAPARKHKSLKSLNASEHDSFFDNYERDNENNNINGYANEEAFISQTEQIPISTKPFATTQEPPSRRPKRPSRSRTRSMSRATSQADSIFGRTDSIMFDEENREPVIEEPCIKDLRDAMGYAIVDKNQNKNWEHKFCTAPRSQNRNSAEPPERPLRNYSTLGPSRPPRKLSKNMTDEEKENIDITQYIEIEDERDLQSGEIIQKMQNRPLPAPPRPPRSKSKPLQDITSESNLDAREGSREDVPREDVHGSQQIDETEVSTQTEPLPADFVCEEVIQEENDKIMTPSAMRKNEFPQDKTDEGQTVRVERVLITPTQYSYQEETITHGQLLVEPLNGAQVLPDSDLGRERIIPITSDEEETSEIPESFNQLSNPESLRKSEPLPDKPIKPPRAQPPHISENFDILKTQKLQVSDLDVDRLTVNELIANKIIVSEIDSGNITSHEISSRSGGFRLGDIEVEPSVVKRLLEQLQESSRLQQSILEDEAAAGHQEDTKVEQKKTSINVRDLETSTSQDSSTTIVLLTDQDIPSESHDSLPQLLSPSLEENIICESETTINEPTRQFSEESKGEQLNSPSLDETIICETETTIDEPTRQFSEESKEETNSDNVVDVPSNSLLEENLETLDTTPSVNLEFKNEEAPVRPPRHSEKKSNGCEMQVTEDTQLGFSSDATETSQTSNEEALQEDFEVRQTEVSFLEMLKPEIDDEPPPRPPQPQVPYIPSQPPVSFYALRAQQYVEGIPDDIPLVPRRKRHHRPPTISKSSSSESSGVPMPRRRVRSPEPSIPQLTGQLVCACSIVARNTIKRLIEQLNENIASTSIADAETRQNVQVIIVILLVLIAGLLLLGYGDGTTVHLHHWEYFNPPKDI